jgi:hypothetical protein
MVIVGAWMIWRGLNEGLPPESAQPPAAEAAAKAG